jgi:hypothetical protein
MAVQEYVEVVDWDDEEGGEKPAEETPAAEGGGEGESKDEGGCKIC